MASLDCLKWGSGFHLSRVMAVLLGAWHSSCRLCATLQGGCKRPAGALQATIQAAASV